MEQEFIPIKEKLQLTDIFADNRIKQIKWGDEFLAWPEDKQLKYAMALASAMNEAASKMQEDRDRIHALLQVAVTKREEAEKSAQISQMVMTRNIVDSNVVTQQLQSQIQTLQGELSEIRRILK